MSHKGSNTRALKLARMSACRLRTSRRAQLVMEGFAPSGGGGVGGGGGGLGSRGPGSTGPGSIGSRGSIGSPGRRLVAMRLSRQLGEVGRHDFVVRIEGKKERGQVMADLAQRF